MPRRAHAAGCVVNSLSCNLSNQSSGVWVSDALLTETIRRFCHGPRRYGSNTPGPLESRRRSAKRKNTSLAYVGGGANVYDQSVMLGIGSKEQWWKDPRQQQIPPGIRPPADLVQEQGGQETSILPLWLSKALSLEQAATSDAEQAEVTTSVQTKLDADVKDLELDLQYRLARLTDLKSIKEATLDLEPNFRSRPELSKLVFCHLLRIDGGAQQYEQVSLALHDPMWNPPGSSNLLLVLQHICSNQISSRSWASYLLPALLQITRVGLVSAQDIQKAILLVPKIYHTMLGLPAKSLVHYTWHRLLIAIKQSQVLCLMDLDASFLKTWYQDVDDTVSLDKNTLDLMWQLKEYANKPELSLASDLLVRRLKALVETGKGASENVIDWFATVAKELQGAVLIGATFKLMDSANADESSSTKLLEKWASVLPQLYPRNREDFPINYTSWTQTRRGPHTLSPPQQILSMIWTAATLWTSQHCTTPQLTSLGMKAVFELTFATERTGDDIDTIGQVVKCLDTLPLPDKDRILQHLQYFSDHDLLKLLGHEYYQNGLVDSFRNEYMSLIDLKFTNRARYKFPHVIGALCESANADLRKFRAMAQILIFRGRDYFPIIYRLLRDNRELKFALARSWTDAHRTHARKYKTKTHKGPVAPEVALRTVEQIMMAFAVCPVISHREAYKKVYKMYLFLHKAGAPITPLAVRALWHAGVTRFGNMAVATTQIKWCLSKVEEIEGQEVAERLLRDAESGKDFLRRFTGMVERDRRLLNSKMAKLQATNSDDGYLKLRRPAKAPAWERKSPHMQGPGWWKNKGQTDPGVHSHGKPTSPKILDHGKILMPKKGPQN